MSIQHLQPPSHAQRVALFGALTFKPAPRPGNPEAVRVSPDWVREHLVTVPVPQLARFGVRSPVTVHYKAAEPLRALWQAWDDAGLLELVKSWDGMWVARYKRGMSGLAENLSNHTWATAFDINAHEWPLGRPCPEDHPFRQLISVAEAHGWAWGGHYKNRVDAMHFELARV